MKPAVSEARLAELCLFLHDFRQYIPSDVATDIVAVIDELLRARSALADVGECERCKGEGYAVDDIDTQFRTSEYYPRCEDCNGTGKQPRPFTVEK